MDTSAPLVGERARRALLDYVVDVGDAAETSYLEVKSEIDLTKTAGVAKVAKFLLGASNRSRTEAARHFGGFAVMVLGAGKGCRRGVPAGTEPHELEERLRPYLGTSFPAYDLERLPADDPSREVLFVFAAPPYAGQPPFPCRKNFQGDRSQETLEDGRIYIRASSNTRPANSGDIDALVERARGEAARREVDLAVEALGPIHRVVNIEELIGWLFDRTEHEFREALTRPEPESDRPAFLPPAVLGSTRRLSLEERRDRLEHWISARPEHAARGRNHLLGVLLEGMRLSLTSCSRFLDRPRFTVVFHDCSYVEYLEADDFDQQTLTEPVLGRQEDSYGALYPVMATPALANYPVRWRTAGPDVQVTLSPDSLHSGEPWISESDDYCLIAESGRPAVHVSWTMTEHGNDEVYRGELEVPTAAPKDLVTLFQKLIESRHDVF